MSVLDCRVVGMLVFVTSVLIVAAQEQTTQKLIGGWLPIDVNDEKVQRVADFALEEIRKNNNPDFALLLLRIEEASSQVVNGKKYRLKLTVKNTTCVAATETRPGSCETHEETCTGDVHVPIGQDTSPESYTITGGSFICKDKTYLGSNRPNDAPSRNLAIKLFNSRITTVGVVWLVLAGLHSRYCK